MFRHVLYAHKADCVWVGRKILEAKGKSRSTTFVQRRKRNFQTDHNGVFPSVAIFAGQLKRNQLYDFSRRGKVIIMTQTHAHMSHGAATPSFGEMRDNDHGKAEALAFKLHI